MPSSPMLSTTELLQAQSLVRGLQPGRYELSQIYGPSWLSVTNPTNFGARFKASVIAGQLEFIELSEKKSNNHQTYEILRSTLRTQ